MKQKVNLIIVALASAILVWGFVACIVAYTNANPKVLVASASSHYRYAKDGRQMTTSDVAEENAKKYVKSLKAENINECEYYRRLTKNKKILMNIAKEEYKEDSSDNNLIVYNVAKADYKATKSTYRAMRQINFTLCNTLFFGTYFPIIVMLGIGFFINQKISYEPKCSVQ